MKNKLSIIAALMIILCTVVILTSCGKNNSEKQSGDPALQFTDDGRAVFDGNVYSKYTEIK